MVEADHRASVPEWLSTSGRLLGLAALSWVIFGAVFASGRVTFHRVQGAVVLYLNFALFFAVLYRLIEILSPDAFHRAVPGSEDHGVWAEMLYFSFTTLTTAGYGDITPVQPLARSLANLESVVGQLYPATLVARLVSLELEHRRRSKSQRD
jgi:voltage-gated potassium channel Kch